MTNQPILDDGKLPVYVLTAAHEGNCAGMIITWLMSASIVPDSPRVIVALSPLHRTTELILASRRFVINTLASDQAELIKTFGLRSSRDIDKFSDTLHYDGENGIPVLENTRSHAYATVIGQMNSGDREILVAELSEAVTDEAKQPLIFSQALEQLPDAVKVHLKERYTADIERDRNLQG
jgi:flavin reductase (DIM6/NTAB) family NADH-FMN oxidoreductase RutF